MQKCLNCAEPVMYVVNNPGSAVQHFCASHLPRFINPTKLPEIVSLFTKPVDPRIGKEETAVAVTSAKTKKKSSVKTEEVVEEPATAVVSEEG